MTKTIPLVMIASMTFVVGVLASGMIWINADDDKKPTVTQERDNIFITDFSVFDDHLQYYLTMLELVGLQV